MSNTSDFLPASSSRTSKLTRGSWLLAVMVASLLLSPLPGSALERRPASPLAPPAAAATPTALVLKFHEGTGIRLRDGLLTALVPDPEFAAGELDDDTATAQLLLASHPQVVTLDRLFSAREDKLARRRLEARTCTASEIADLDLYYLVGLVPGTPFAAVRELLDELGRLASVEIAYAQSLTLAPDLGPRTGTGAACAAALDRARDLGSPLPTAVPCAAAPASDRDVLVVAVEESAGTSPSLARAINQAAITLEQQGKANGQGILLLRAQLLLDQEHAVIPLPVEYEPATFDAIREATCNGVIVVEAVGDGGVDLDDPVFDDRFDRDVQDSGAIMVATSRPAEPAPVPAEHTNFGRRVDVNLPVPSVLGGSGDATAAAAAPPAADPADSPASDAPFFDDSLSFAEDFFADTGSAEAAEFAAEAVATVQEMRHEQDLAPFSGDEMRDFLDAGGREPGSHEDEQSPDADDELDERPIGKKPDLAKDVDNAPPAAGNDELTVPEGALSFDVYHSALLQNDTDPDGDFLRVVEQLESEPTYGRIEMQTGRFIYFPGEEFTTVGSDSFTYSISDRRDATGLQNVATVTLRFNRPAVAENDLLLVPADSEGFKISVRDLLQNDSDPDGDVLRFQESMVTQPRRGQLKVDSGRLVYKPGPDFWQHCTDRFTYRLSDRDDYSGAISLPAAVTLSCHPVFVDGFDSQSVAAWAGGQATGGARLDVAAEAAIVGSHGLAVALSGQDGDRAFVTAPAPADSPRYRASFFVDPAQAELAEGDELSIFAAQPGEPGALAAHSASVLDVRLGRRANQLYVRARTRDQANTWHDSTPTVIAGQARIEVFWWSDTEGGLRLSVDGRHVDTLAVANEQLRIAQAHLGVLDGVGAGTQGTFTFDQFESYRSAE